MKQVIEKVVVHCRTRIRRGSPYSYTQIYMRNVFRPLPVSRALCLSAYVLHSVRIERTKQRSCLRIRILCWKASWAARCTLYVSGVPCGVRLKRREERRLCAQRLSEGPAEELTAGLTDRLTDRWTDRWIHRRTDRQ